MPHACKLRASVLASWPTTRIQTTHPELGITSCPKPYKPQDEVSFLDSRCCWPCGWSRLCDQRNHWRYLVHLLPALHRSYVSMILDGSLGAGIVKKLCANVSQPTRAQPPSAFLDQFRATALSRMSPWLIYNVAATLPTALLVRRLRHSMHRPLLAQASICTGPCVSLLIQPCSDNSPAHSPPCLFLSDNITIVHVWSIMLMNGDTQGRRATMAPSSLTWRAVLTQVVKTTCESTTAS